MVIGSSDFVTNRLAAPTDAGVLSSLYREAYDPKTGAPPEEFYPFPDLMSPEKLAILLENNLWLWIVACQKTEIIGVVGAKLTHQVGALRPMLADVLGFVVRSDWRGRGVGGQLLRYLNSQLDNHVDWILAETRINTPASWKAFRRCGYRIVGYEPFCHRTAAGYEAMLLQGRVSARRFRLRRTSSPRTGLEVLANEISRNVCPAVHDNGGLATDGLIEGRERNETSASDSFANCIALRVESAVCLKQLQRHLCSTRLKEFTIETPSLALVAEIDPIDLRLYIASLISGTTFSNVAGDLRGLFGEIERYMLDQDLQSSIIEVELSKAGLIEILLEKGYKPTAVYPALLREGSCFSDVVQFTRSLRNDPILSEFSAFDMEANILNLIESVRTS